ncbi:MAG: ABC transporter substrate-binding protein [Clostridiales bacterium]|nr:ABC transporter substrate-binding protein [Clostridiales bacterium]
MKKFSIRIISMLVSLMLMLTMLTACGPQSVVSAGETVSFTDALGRNVAVNKNPKRVAALIGSFADVWLLSGGSVCATVEDAWDDFNLDIPNAVNIGGAHSPNLELLLTAEPDFVIASASTASNVEMKKVLENVGIVVAYFDVDNFDDYLSMLSVCTDITGRKDLFELNGLKIKEQIDSIKAEFKKANLPENERSVLLLRAASGFVKAKGSTGTILGEMLSDLGCINIADSDSSLLETLSVESVIRQEPYRIFVVTMGDDTEKALDNFSRMMEENPAWGTLSAVIEGRVHIMDRKLFNIKPNAKWAESYEKLSKILLGEE